MPLDPGTKLGPYEILAPLGAGGMGEVYRARDTRLERAVAIKILPAHLSADPARKMRFEREAKTVSALNHPNICSLFDVGSQDGIDFLVMECIEGESLADRLAKGPLPVEQVLKIGTEIADALDKAHRSGVVHRDLKPGNIMLTKTGAKLLDFGLAKPTTTPAGAVTVTNVAANSPVTEQGIIVGTFQYMSPEQVEGKELDGRSDIFSLGAVLYEMLTGKRAFEGKNQLSVASAILEKEPEPISTSKPLTPPALNFAVKKCLAKAPDERWQSASDLASDLKWIAESSSQAVGVSKTGGSLPSSRTGWTTAGIALAALFVGIMVAYFWRPVPGGRVIRSSILPPENFSFGESANSWAATAVSPDGSRIVVGVIGQASREMLYVRPLDALTGQILAGTEGATFPFWSPDGRSIGFFADGQLKTIDASSGPVQVLCPAPEGRGGTWNRDGVIVFAPSPVTNLYRIAATGGTPAAVTKLDTARHEDTHRWPQFLPDGRHFLYLARTLDINSSEIHVGSTDSAEAVSVVGAMGNPVYAAAGYLVYPRGNLLVAQLFDTDHL